MTIRYNARSQARFNVPGLPSGYQSKISSDFTVPAVGIDDVERALFTLFNDELPLIVEAKRVPVIFFTGEKWALNKKLRALRDRNNTLILPLITAVRTSLVQDSAQDIAGRGINQQTGEIVIHRRLDKSDRAYQGLINRTLLKHQRNLAVSPGSADPGQLTTLREVGDLANDPIVQQGGLLLPNRTRNVYETIVVPAPQFFTAQYDFTLWAQYNTHMNQMIEGLLSSFLPQGNAWRLDTPKGYWFIATVDDNSYTADLNADDYSQEERLIRYKFVVNVPGYIMASKVPGAPVPVRRYVSSPTVSFDLELMDSGSDPVDAPFLGADDPTLPLTDLTSPRADQRQVNGTPLYPPSSLSTPDDPALKAIKRGTKVGQYKKITGIDKNGQPIVKLFKVTAINSKAGETVLSPGIGTDGLPFMITDD